MPRDLSTLKKAILKFTKDRDWEQFHTPKNLAMAMSVEAAEIVEIFQWLTEKQAATLSPKQKEALSDELADTFMYLIRLGQVAGIDLVDASFRKMAKNAAKYPVSKARGRMTKYHEL